MLICRDLRSGTGCGAQNDDDATACRACGRQLRYALQLRNLGSIVSSYRVVRVIGHGGFGAVYEAEVVRRPTIRVALKETFEQVSIQRFEAEFEVLRGLQHDNLPRYYEMFRAEDHGFLVMEMIPGQSLNDILRKQAGPVLERLVLSYADQLCDVLTYLHSQDPPIIHRDVKPANVRLTPEGLIKLVDFGLLKQGTETTQQSFPRAGTLAYTPFEQWIGGTDQRSDIYSLGATLYHMLTGQTPPSAAHRSTTNPDPLLPPSRYNTRISDRVSGVILKSLALSRDQRYPSVAAFHKELMRAAGKRGATGNLSVPPPVPVPALAPDTLRVATVISDPPPSVVPETPSQSQVPRISGATQSYVCMATGDIVALAWSPDGKTLASAGDDGTIRLWRRATDRDAWTLVPLTLAGGVGRIFCIAWSPDGKALATGSRDRTVRLWRANDGGWLGSWSGHTGDVLALAWRHDSTMLASAGRDATVRLWNASNGRQMAEITDHTDTVYGVAWCLGGSVVASAGSDSTVRLFRSETGVQQSVLRGHRRWITCLAASPDGQALASASADGTVRLWRPADGSTIAVMSGHLEPIQSVSWSPDGQALVSGGEDRTVGLWHTNDGSLISLLGKHQRAVTCVAWSPDGQFIASASADQTIRLWRVKYD